MPKRCTDAWKAHLAQDPSTMATCWRIQRLDGTVLCFTNHSDDLWMDDNLLNVFGLSFGSSVRNYYSNAGIAASQVNEAAGTKANNANLKILLDNGQITEADLWAGKLDQSDVMVFTVNYNDVAGMGPFDLWRGYLGETSKDGSWLSLEVQSLFARTDQNVGRITGETCPYVFGDAFCGVDLGGNNPDGVPYTLTGRTVTSFTNRVTFNCAALI